MRRFLLICITIATTCAKDQWKEFEIWGPALEANKIVLPAQYLQIQDLRKTIPDAALPNNYDFTIDGTSKVGPCRFSVNQLFIGNRTTIIRFKFHDACHNAVMEIKLDGHHLSQSPYKLPGVCYPETCYCPQRNTDSWLETAHCQLENSQIAADLVPFRAINFTLTRNKILEKFNEPGSVSICNYVVKDNEIFRKCYGQYTGFKMFMDAILLSMTRKMRLADTEFFINLGDWPLVKKGGPARTHGPLPMFSWCGSEDTFDIVLPTYDITESTLENMGRVMLDMLSVQKLKTTWNQKIEKGFWRGRDSRRERLDIIDISRKHPDLINAALTNFFFFRDEAHKYGPKVPHISFMDFFEYKYQINIDGTVAAYRFPYLLAGGSTVFKQESTFYEHFYRQLKANYHYVPIKRDLSDLVDKLRWAQMNDEKAMNIMENGRKFAQMNLLPLDIFCYHALLLKRYTEAIVSEIVVQPGMEKVPQQEISKNCDCDLKKPHDEL